MTVRPGWYPDPAEPTNQRYWDGEGWVGAPLPVDVDPPPGPPAEEPAPAEEPPPTEKPAPANPPPSGREPALGPSGPAPLPGPGWPGGPPGTAGPPGVPGWPPGYPYRGPAVLPSGLPLASLGARLVARLIDIGLVLLLNVLVNGFFVYRYVKEVLPVSEEFSRRWLTGERMSEPLPQPGGQAEALQIVILLVAVALWFAYEVPATANTGQTVGKRVMGIRVVPLAGTEPLGFGRSLRRFNLLGLPVFLWSCCGVGFLLQLVDCALPLVDRPWQQALHDKRAQTVVAQALPTAGTSRADDRTDPSGGDPA